MRDRQSIYRFWKGKSVLITGHSGFKGSWLVVLLQELGAIVSGLSLDEKSSELYRSLCSRGLCTAEYNADVTNLSSIAQAIEECQPDVIFHLAAQALVGVGYENPVETWATNVIGSVNVLEAARSIRKTCALVMVTTDKVYKNEEWEYGYRETDALGGADPYSASKSAMEIAITSWRESFSEYDYHTGYLRVASARAGNVIGGGDFSQDRLIPDTVRALVSNQPLTLRRPLAVRPWQHVLECLDGYITLAESLYSTPLPNMPFEYNFGPQSSSHVRVEEIADLVVEYWGGSITVLDGDSGYKESNLLHLDIDRTLKYLDWKPRWAHKESVRRTVLWYKSVLGGAKDPYECCLQDVKAYLSILH